MIQIEKKHALKKTACLSCGKVQEYTVTVRNKTALSEIHLCRKCLRELTARTARVSRLYASEEKNAFS